MPPQGGQAPLQPRADPRDGAGLRARRGRSRSATRICPHDVRTSQHGAQYLRSVPGACAALRARASADADERLLPDRPHGRAAQRRASSTSSRSRGRGSSARRSPAGRATTSSRLMGALRAASQMVSLRGHAGPVARRRDDDLRHRPPRRHGPLAGRARVGHLRAAARVLPLLRGGRRRDQAHPVRPARGRERARVGLLHRVLGHEVRDVLLRRVHGGRDELDAPRDDLPRRLAAAVLPPRRAARSRSATRRSLHVPHRRTSG